MSERKRVILASASARRREILSGLDILIDVVPSAVAEPPPERGVTPGEYVVRLAETKARHVARTHPGAVVVGADTSVVLDGAVLGKPADDTEARAMLTALRGRDHQVLTGLAVVDADTWATHSALAISNVTMRPYSDAEIEHYIATGDPFDKAGGYAIQHPAFRPAASFTGCYLNIVGLPMCEVVELLDRTGVRASVKPGWEPPQGCERCAAISRRVEAGV